ncbi:uncharacterized protein EDB91DRAFT_1080898 [Suillus paluster]|uniref:uncharacterized protein n=1 Tax=Suillus paluster TaxID=48578 RepID=UPI001B8783FC|nr:uncharacterized protein EDB91DRAFT_1080898 [Suillus paluster]KAG1744092.1 hypothetical protein EDB91DRAFT_1080898 [Suillus paluster]
MPFEQYLADDKPQRSQQYSNHYSNYNDGCYSINGHEYSNGIHFKIYQFMYDGPSILTSGGGVKVLPPGLLDSPVFILPLSLDVTPVWGKVPDGNIQKSKECHFILLNAIAYLKKSLSADEEYQTSIINYRKDRQAFINLVTVVGSYITLGLY